VNINDYLKNNQAKISKENPFNNLDSLVLARVSYLPFSKIKFKNHESLKSATDKMQKLKTSDFLLPLDQTFAQLVGQSSRFSHLLVSDFIRHNDPEISKQFSAITIRIRFNIYYISFYGTDDSTYGWKEDFNMSFMENVPAQRDAFAYTKFQFNRHPFARFYLGGHSKGGNVAMYSAVVASDRMQRRMIKIDSFDGPGLTKALHSKDTGRPVVSKIENFIPQDSVIGRLFTHREKMTVVKSNARNLYQHDIYSWQVTKNNFQPAESTKKSDYIDRAITSWIESATPEQRELFINALFEVFQRSGFKNPMQLSKVGLKAIPSVFKSYQSATKEDRKIITFMIRKLIKNLLSVI